MKKFLLAATTLIFFTTSAGFADIQSPPGGKYNRVRKLSRGVANMVYGLTEVPQTMQLTQRTEGSGAFALGLIDGTKRSVVRFGFGVYEVFTFPIRTHKGGFLPPGKKIWWDLNGGYTEFPPQIGMKAEYPYNRIQHW